VAALFGPYPAAGVGVAVLEGVPQVPVGDAS
jgi:hypothetical protein